LNFALYRFRVVVIALLASTTSLEILTYRVVYISGSSIDPTIADGILDRLVHNAHRIEMRGDSMRKKHNPPRDKSEEQKE